MCRRKLQLTFETSIRASAERVFEVLADFRSYDRWLPRSSAFHGTTEISDDPIRLGTTYVEPGPTGVRRGRVIENRRVLAAIKTYAEEQASTRDG